MQICFTSYRAFPDGPVRQPFEESDPANIAYALGGTYISFYTLKRLSDRQLEEALRPFDLVIVALDVEAIELVRRIVETCKGRVATYSEGHIADYQRLSPAGQVSFLTAIRSASINFLYWEKYVPFYRALTDVPVEYLPYPYLIDEVHRHYIPLDQRPYLAALPSGLAGYTRNGLATLAVAKRLLDEGLIQEVICWLDAETFEEDARAIQFFLYSTPFTNSIRTRKFNWRKWFLASRMDYRYLLKLKAKLRGVQLRQLSPEAVKTNTLSLHRRGGWLNYIAQLARARILIDLNNRETVGRNALDCAALGIPCVSTDRSDLHSKIFPETTLTDSWNIDTAVQMCRHLLTDSAFHERVLSHAATAVQRYDLDHSQQRIGALVVKYLMAA